MCNKKKIKKKQNGHHFICHRWFVFWVGHQQIFVIDLPQKTCQLLLIYVVPENEQEGYRYTAVYSSGKSINQSMTISIYLFTDETKTYQTPQRKPGFDNQKGQIVTICEIVRKFNEIIGRVI